MNTRILSVVAVATVMTLNCGCSGMRNFLFGRGARCGLCNRMETPAAPVYAAPEVVPYAAPCPPPPCGTPVPQGVVTAPPADCGCHPVPSCGSCGDSMGYSMSHSGCGCGSSMGHGVPVVTDPYMSGQVIGGVSPYPGQIVEGPVVSEGQVYPSAPTPTIQSDNFSARKFDSDGNKILWEEPLPQGTTAL